MPPSTSYKLEHCKELTDQCFGFSFFSVAGDDKWKFVAEKLGLSQEEICYLDKRTQNPVEGLIGFIAGQRFMSVGDLCKVLCDCGVPLIADKSL